MDEVRAVIITADGDDVVAWLQQRDDRKRLKRRTQAGVADDPAVVARRSRDSAAS